MFVTVIALKYALLVSQLSFGYAPADGSSTVAPSAIQTAPIIMMESARAYVAGKSLSGGHKAVAAA